MFYPVRKLIAAAFLSGSALAAVPAYAEEKSSDFTISGYVTGVTDYRWRGVSASAGDFAIQGAINLNHSSGLYITGWASNIEDSDVYGNSEVDINAGWAGDVGGGVTADVGMYLYAYPNGHVGKANVWEPYASLSKTIGPVTGKVGVNYAWHQEALGGDDNLYISTDFTADVPGAPVVLAAHLGYTDGAWSPNVLTEKSNKGGFDYTLGATYNITDRLSLGATYVGVDGYSLDGYTNDTIVGSITLAF
ncbi:MAG: TorF family putative porin [Chakrabartia sp.]